MQKTEAIKLIGVCSANYKNWPEEGKMEHLIELWMMMLADMPYEVAQRAIQYHLSRSVYPPTIADIREAAAQVSRPRAMEAIEAWDMISEAIRKFGSYKEKEGLESLPEEVRAMARRFGWRELCLNENPDTLRAQFRMAWETHVKRMHEDSKLPPALQELIDTSGVLKRLA